ncbi:metalloregulator ArsR/SmtB family transcription factor [Stieleria sp. JC731]|uniref:ArsR/SmtB family transcription factor n=1 Tax=Pirellulaceae TaxID=2691357 RepID=UPI001E4E49FB|nr:metalloregulator ArsR/SmtB family transcription factor [Stieleria sp. JC731]MCC9602186.1 metalloregulator ArsR/SmtB family transcription factor [Stieleria sp. JC731]
MSESNENTPSNDETCATYLKAIADPLRLKVVRALQMGPLSVSDIAELVQQEIGTVSHHLRVLYHADIVQTRREGKFIYYSLNEEILRAKKRKPDAVFDFGCCKLDVSE